MNILAFDSSSDVLSLAFQCDKGIFYSDISPAINGINASLKVSHSELLMEAADGLFKSAGLKPKELNIVACMKGPGSFTGLRISFSAGKGIALALGIPLIAIPTLDCISYPFSTWPGIVLPVIDAKKGCFFAAFYREGKLLTEYMDANLEMLVSELKNIRTFENEPVFLTGGGAQLLLSRLQTFMPLDNIKLDPVFYSGRARELLEIIKNTKIFNLSEINSAPVYLRKSDAELKYI